MAKIWWTRLQRFLFPSETDKWLSVLRVGLGLQVITYALFLRGDWHYLFASTGKGLVSRELGEAITAFDSPFIPKLGWLVALGRSINISEETVLSVAWACLLCMGFFCWSDFSAGRQRSLHGFFTSVLLKVAGYLRTEPIAS